MARGGSVAGFAAVLAIAPVPACTLLLDFSSPIVRLADAGGPDATDTCQKDEPNDDLAGATPAVAGVVQASVCPVGDRDFYRFTLDGATDLIATLSFAGRGGTADLELTLFNLGTMSAVTTSTGLDDDERIEHTAALANVLPAGDYAVEVLGRDDLVQNSYDLELMIGAPPAIDAGVIDAAP